jgi:hypothetical protein
MELSSVRGIWTMTGRVMVTVLFYITEPGGTRTVTNPTLTGRMGDPGCLVSCTMSGMIGKTIGNR